LFYFCKKEPLNKHPMKIFKLVLIALLAVTSLEGSAQDYTFRVLVNKGKNEVKAGEAWQAIKVGSSLKSADEVKVSENAYIGLAHVSGKTLELKQPGKYKVADLAARVSGTSSVLNKYTDFVLSANTERKNNQVATGAVDRGQEFVLFIPNVANNPVVYSDVISIDWDDVVPGPYIVEFKSMFDDELAKFETNETFQVINLSDAKFANEDNILVKVYPKSDAKKGSDLKSYTLKRLSKADKDRIKAELAGQTLEQTAISKLMLAAFYEKNGLLIDAATAYQDAIKLEPTVTEFQQSYQDFLTGNNLKKKKATPGEQKKIK
jgi:hypothetical protein